VLRICCFSDKLNVDDDDDDDDITDGGDSIPHNMQEANTDSKVT